MTGTLWITGASGFTGRHQASLIRAECPEVAIVEIDLHGSPAGPGGATAIDLNDWVAVRALARSAPPTWVLHLAGRTPPATDAELWRANVGATMGLFRGLSLADCTPRIVCVGSAAEYAPESRSPISEDAVCGGASSYGDTKLAQSLLALALGATHGMQVVIARTFNLVGPGLPTTLVVGHLAQQFASRQPSIQVGSLDSARDFVDVRDAVRAYWLLVQPKVEPGVYNVASGLPVSVATVVERLCHITGLNPLLEADSRRARAQDVPVVFGDSRRLREATGWSPTLSLDVSLSDMVRHYSPGAGAGAA